MIKLDFGKAIPPQLAVYLLGIIPGAFFEVSVAIGNPALAASVVSKLQNVYPIGHYSVLFLFLASSLFIGEAFLILAWFVDMLVAVAFTSWHYLIKFTLGSQWLYKRFCKWQGLPSANTKWSIRMAGRVIMWARIPESNSPQVQATSECVRIATKQLLMKRYGINLDDRRNWGLNSDWNPWYSALGKPLKAVKEASRNSRVFMGCTFAGLAAVRFAPALRGASFATLLTVFAVAGVYISIDLARWRSDTGRFAMERLVSILLELAAVTAQEKQEEEAANTGA